MPNFGDIVVIRQMLDSRGANPKDRPCVVITPDADLASGMAIVVVAISTLRPGRPPGSDCVMMANDPAGHPVTGLKTECAAFPRWSEAVDPARIKKTIGRANSEEILAIAVVKDSIRGKGGRPRG